MTSAVAYPADPPSTASATLVMAGLGVMFSAGDGGNVLVVVTCDAFTATGSVNMTVGGRFGTGAPPNNGDAVSGSRFGAVNDKTLRPAGTTGGVGVTLADVVHLTPGTNYWFDLAFSTSNASDAATLQSVGVVLAEAL